ASNTVRQPRQRNWRTMAWVPNSEITWLRSDPQKGQRGAGRGSSSGVAAPRSGRHEPLLFEPPEHVEGALVDAAALAFAAAARVPSLPVDSHFGRLHLKPLHQARHELGRAHAQDAARVQLGNLAGGWTEPGQRLPPGLIERLLLDPAAQPGTAVQEVVALLHQHLPQARLQHLDVALDAGLDHGAESGVEHGVGGHEVAP